MVSSKRIVLPVLSIRSLGQESAVVGEVESRNVPANILGAFTANAIDTQGAL